MIETALAVILRQEMLFAGIFTNLRQVNEINTFVNNWKRAKDVLMLRATLVQITSFSNYCIFFSLNIICLMKLLTQHPITEKGKDKLNTLQGKN